MPQPMIKKEASNVSQFDDEFFEQSTRDKKRSLTDDKKFISEVNEGRNPDKTLHI